MRRLARTGPFLILVALLLLSAGCVSNFQAPVFQGLSDFGINRNNPEKAVQVEVAARVFNPNRAKIKILDYDLEFFLNGSPLGKASSKVNQVLAKEAASELSLGLRSSMKEVFGATASLLLGLGDSNIKLRIKGNVRASVRGFSKRFPVDIEHLVPFSGK